MCLISVSHHKLKWSRAVRTMYYALQCTQQQHIQTYEQYTYDTATTTRILLGSTSHSTTDCCDYSVVVIVSSARVRLIETSHLSNLNPRDRSIVTRSFVQSCCEQLQYLPTIRHQALHTFSHTVRS